MRFDLRQAGAVALLALLISPAALIAQETPITVVGSGVVAPVLEALAGSADVADGVDVQVTGTNAGFQALCSGSAQVALATRAISVEEEAACNAAGVAFVELLAGHNIVAFVTIPDSELPQCVTLDDLDAALAPSAQAQVQSWSQVNAAFPDVPLSVYGPAVDSAGYALADRVIGGVGLRGDVQTADVAAVAEAVSSDVGALAFVSLAEAVSAGDSVRILSVDSQDGTGCAAPSAASVENRTYPLADNMLVYVAADALANPALSAILDVLTGDEADALLTDAGYTPATAAAYATDRDAIDNSTTGRQFTVDATGFQVPAQLAGALTVGGSPVIVRYFQDLTAEFTAQYPAVTTTTSFLGSISGLSRLCAGELDIAVADANAEETLAMLADCDANEVVVESIDFGSEAVVLLASADSDYLGCLTPEQIATTWQADGETTISTWNQVSDEFEDAPVYLFTPADGISSSADVLMIETTGTARPTRSDVAERNNDPLYRAAAVANAGSGMTLMSWPDYQTVLNSGQDGVQLVSVNVNDDCVEPTLATINDGSYPLARPVSLLVSQSALARPEVQALLWTTLLDENYGLLQLANLVGIEFGDLPAARSALQAQFDAAAAAPVSAGPEATPDPAATEEAADVTADETEAADEPADETEVTAEATEAS